MKKVFIILLAVTLFVACNETKKSDGEAHAAMIESTMKSDSAPQQIGFQISDKGEKISLYGGDMAAVSLWETYIKAQMKETLKRLQL